MQHFLGLQGILNLVTQFFDQAPTLFMAAPLFRVVFGPQLTPSWVTTTPVFVYDNAADVHKDIGRWRGKAIVYQWFNLITGRTYVGSSTNGAIRLSRYFVPGISNSVRPLERALAKYGHFLFALAIIEVVDTTTNTDRSAVEKREQHWLDILYSTVSRSLIFNLSPTAGLTAGYTHTSEFKLARSGEKNPIHSSNNRGFSPEYLAQQKKDRSGKNNPQWGVIKSPETVAKLTKIIFAYDSTTGALLHKGGTYATTKIFSIHHKTLTRVIGTGEAYHGVVYTRVERLLNSLH